MPPLDHRVADPEDRRVAYQIAAQYELGIGQWRFQLLSIYLAAVGVIVGFGHSARFVGGLLVGITVGVFAIELRNRDLLRRYRPIGKKLEVVDDGIFRGRNATDEKTLAVLFFNDRVLRGWPSRLVSFQVGIDLIFITVIAYGLYLLAK
jgi:hypothetical protein